MKDRTGAASFPHAHPASLALIPSTYLALTPTTYLALTPFTYLALTPPAYLALTPPVYLALTPCAQTWEKALKCSHGVHETTGGRQVKPWGP